MSLKITELKEAISANEKGWLFNINSGELDEVFFLSTVFWSIEEYKSSWKRQVEALLENSKSAVLITSIHEPSSMNFARGWVIYPVEDSFYLQEKVFFKEEFLADNSFDIQKLFNENFEHKQFTEENHPISEWNLKLDDLTGFLKTLS